MSETRQARLVAGSIYQENILFFCGFYQPFGQRAEVIFGHAILPFQEVGNALGFYAQFHAAKAGEKQIHLILKPGRGAQIFCRALYDLDFPAVHFEKSPPRWKFINCDE